MTTPTTFGRVRSIDPWITTLRQEIFRWQPRTMPTARIEYLTRDLPAKLPVDLSQAFRVLAVSGLMETVFIISHQTHLAALLRRVAELAGRSHRHGERANMRINNLRLATYSQNACNRDHSSNKRAD